MAGTELAIHGVDMVWNSSSAHHFPLNRQSDGGFLPADRSGFPEDRASRLASFEALVRRWDPIVYEFCRHLFPDPAMAGKACEDAFVALFRSDAELEKSSILLSGLFGYLVDLACDLANRDLGVEKGRGHGLAAGLSRLLPGDRDLVALRFIIGLSLDEIAALLELDEGQIRVRLWNAMSAFERSIDCERSN